MPNGNNVTTSTELISQVIDSENTLHGIRAGAIPYGEVDDTSTSTVFTATVPGIVTLTDGVCVLLRNGKVTSAADFTLNINSLGAKPVYNNLATGNDVANPPTVATRDTTIFNVAYTMLFIYTTSNKFNDGNGAWICFRGYDSNTNTIGYQVRTNSSNMVASDTGYRYRIWLTSADGTKWVPINTSTSTNSTTARTLNTRIIDPFGAIVYRATNGTCNSGTGLGATGIWQQYTLTIGYSYVKTLTYPAPVYLRCTPQTSGGAKMQDIVQALPSSKDGKIYIFLGTAYSASAMELQIVHPVYWHDGTGIRFWTGAEMITATATTAANGLMSSTDKQQLNTAYNHASSKGTSAAAGLYKISANSEGHITGTTAVQKSDITALGIPASDNNTTYAAGTGLTLNNSSFNLSTVVAGGSAGPTAAVTGNDGTTVAIPRITVDNYGRITSFTTYALTNKNTTYADATESAHGLMTAADKQKLNNLTTVMKYMGTVASTTNLPSLTTADAGKVYHVTANGGEYAWDGSAWQELGSHIDLSNYLTGINKSTTTIKNPTAKTVVVGGTTTAIPNISKKTVVTGVTTGTINQATSKNVVTGVTPANVVTGWSTVSITPAVSKTVVTGVTKKTVVIGATTATIKNPTAKSVVVNATTGTIKNPTAKTVVTGITTTTIKNPTSKNVVVNGSTTTAIIGGNTSSITPVTKKTVVVSGNNVSINNPTSKTVVTAVTPNTVITNVSTTSITPVTKKTVVVSGSTKAAVTGISTTSITPVTKKTVVISGSTKSAVVNGTTSSITPVTGKTVVTTATMPTLTYSSGVLTFNAGTVGTGDSVTAGTAVKVYTGLTTDSVIGSVSTGDSVTTGTAVNVATGITTESFIGSVSTGDSVTTGTAVTVLNGSTSGAAASVTTGASITVTPTTVVGSLNTGDSVTTGTAINAYTSLTTGSVIGSVSTGASITTDNTTVVTGVTTGDSISTTNTTVVTGVSKEDSITTSNATVVSAVSTGDSVDVTTGDSITNGTAQTVIASLSTGAAASVTTGASISTSPATVVKSATTGDSVTVGTAINAYTGLTTGDSITTTNTTVVTDVTGVK